MGGVKGFMKGTLWLGFCREIHGNILSNWFFQGGPIELVFPCRALTCIPLQNAKHGQQSKKADPLHNLYIMPTMALQTSTYHLQNDKRSQLDLNKMPYWTKVDLDFFSKNKKTLLQNQNPQLEDAKKDQKGLHYKMAKEHTVDLWNIAGLQNGWVFQPLTVGIL